MKHFSALMRFPSNRLSEQDALSRDVMIRILQEYIDDYRFKEYEMPVSQRSGPHIGLADLPLAVPFDSVKRYEDYIARLHQIPRVFTQTEEVLRAGMKDNLMPVRFLLEKVPAQCDGIIAADPFLTPTKKFPSSISAADQQRLTQQITDAVHNEVLPAYRAIALPTRSRQHRCGDSLRLINLTANAVARHLRQHQGQQGEIHQLVAARLAPLGAEQAGYAPPRI